MPKDMFDWALLGFAPPQGQGTSTVPPWAQMVPFILLFVVMYLVMIVPGQKKEKQRKAMLMALKIGDKVVTSSGIVGVVVSLRDQSITLRSEESKFEVLKNGIQEVLERKA